MQPARLGMRHQPAAERLPIKAPNVGIQGWRKRIAQKAGRLLTSLHIHRIATALWKSAESAIMTLKLHTYPGNKNAFKALIAAQYIGVQIDVPPFNMGVDNKKPDFLKLNPNGKVGLSLGTHWQELLHVLHHHYSIDKPLRLGVGLVTDYCTQTASPAHLSALQSSSMLIQLLAGQAEMRQLHSILPSNDIAG